MFKFTHKYLDISLFKSCLAFALIYCLLFNSAVFVYKFEYCQANILTAIAELVKDFFYLVITLFVFFVGLSLHRLLFFIGSLILFITGALASYYLFFFSIAPTQALMPSLFGTYPTEIYELLSVRIILWITFSIGVCLYSIKHFNVQAPKFFLTRILSAICLLLVAFNIITPKYSFLKTYFPMQYLHNSYVFFFGKSNNYTKEDISTKFSFIDSSDEDSVGVLVIGESARYGNFSINGYERNTTPNLSKIDGLISFRGHSCSTSTYFSVPCLLSRYGEKDLHLIDTETTVLSVLTKLGFDTVWYGTQSITKHYRSKKGGSFYDEVNFHTVPGGNLVFFPNDDDMKLIPYLKEVLSDKKQFIVLHSTGSHWNYGARYPKEFAKFKPDLEISTRHDPSSCDRERLINSYDNSILYTDFFLSNVIDSLKDKKAFLIYTSDHGESLGESGRLHHGATGYAPEQQEVPFMVWMSDSYRAAHPSKWLAIQSIKDNNISHDYVFHSILDCLGIKSEIIDKSLSICQINSSKI